MDPIESDVIAMVRKAAEGRNVVRSTTWQELGFDSLDVTDLLMQAEERFGVRIPDHEAATLQTVGDMIDFVARQHVG
jgi:NADH dehydrogenase (ubiquinone) 1 alpha/beta subcomplex 1